MAFGVLAVTPRGICVILVPVMSIVLIGVRVVRLCTACAFNTRGQRWWTGESNGGGGTSEKIRTRYSSREPGIVSGRFKLDVGLSVQCGFPKGHLLSQRKAPMAMSLKSFLF